jgi:Mn2+/Fe2+ NRAMP family transporter
MINIGADFAAMGAAAQLATGANARFMVIVFALVSLLLQLFMPYRRYANILKWLTLSLLSYVALLFAVKIDWQQLLRGLAVPSLAGPNAISTIVAVFGTTISPYLFFWQSSQEVEETEQDDDAQPLIEEPQQAPTALRGMRIDTFIGMAASNLVALAIIIATAATLHESGKTSINTAADAANALRPVAGDFAFALFSLGIVGTGMLAVPVLAGSAAYAIGEARGWNTGLDEKPWQAIGFYSVIGAATLLGIGMGYTSIDPMKQLFYSAIINGVVAAPIMAAMMWIASRRDAMGQFIVPVSLRFFGWAATAVMGAASIALFVT